jgi:Protein of unknown function (DUF1403)
MDPATRPVLDANTIPQLPGWMTREQSALREDAAFAAGAALSYLHLVAASKHFPQALWRDRLALLAAQACVGFAGRREGMGALRDAVHLVRIGDQPGPAGQVFGQWRVAVAQKTSSLVVQRVIPWLTADQIAEHFEANFGNPVIAAAHAMQTILAQNPRAETEALILADAVLAQRLGWPYLLPLLGAELKQRDHHKTGDDLVLACHRAVVRSAKSAGQLASELCQKAGLLRAALPKLRAKGALKAVELFLSYDAMAPAELLIKVSALKSDRAARRLCDRLVQLGALRELTGRDSFRLYGV